MTRKEREITELYLQTLKEISSNADNWLSFLKRASYNYKYRFDEQVLIYAQRPDATAVAETKDWNVKLKRWINKNSKYIALMTEKDGNLGLRFVYDVSDTNSNVYHRKFKLWTAEEKYHKDIIEALENRFGKMENSDNLPFAIMSTCFNIINDNMQDYLDELKEIVGDSELSKLDGQELETTFLETLMYSTIALTMSRCGINVEEFVPKGYFSNIEKFNTFETMNILGTATRDFSKEITLEIAEVVINLQKEEKNKIYTFDNDKQKVYDEIIKNMKGSVANENNRERRLQDSSTREQIQESRVGEIRENETKIPKREQEGNVHNPTYEQQFERTFDRNRQNSEGQNSNNNRTNEERTEYNGRNESRQSNGMGTTDEQYKGHSRTDSNKGTNTNLSDVEEANTNASFFNDLKIIDILKNAPNVIKNRDEIDNYISKFDSNINQLEEIKNKDYFKNILGNAYTEFYFDNERVGYVTSENALTIWRGNYLQREEEISISWEEVIENFILEYDSRVFNREVQTKETTINTDNYVFRVGDSIFIGLDEFKIADINNDEYTIYNVQFPLLQEKININEKIQKIAENPLNDYLKERDPEEFKEKVEENSFNNWLDTFIEEKEIDLNETFTIESNGQAHIFEIGNIIENIKATSSNEQNAIKDMIVKIDFHNGDVVDYFKHLAKALVENYEREEIKVQEQTEDKQDKVENTNNETITNIPRVRKNRNIEYFDLHPEVPTEERNNFKITNDNLGIATAKEKFRNNVEAIKVLKKCEEENRYATKEEQQILSNYVGWGGLKSAFESDNSSWSEEYVELKNLLTEAEYKDARKSSMTAYYTPPMIIRNIYKALRNMGLKQANILEPSCRNR